MGGPFVRWRAGTCFRVILAATLALSAGLLVAILLARPDSSTRLSSSDTGSDDGWAGSFLHDRADAHLNGIVEASSRDHVYASCPANEFKLPGAKAWMPAKQFEQQLAMGRVTDDAGAQRFVEVTAKAAPCADREKGMPCCKHTVFFRPNTTDYKVFQQIFQWHYMRYLYAIFEHSQPKFILDAGANAGFSTLLFKLLWPDAVVVAVEPDPGNFQALVTQTRSLQGVHVLNAGLWGRRARIGQTGDHGAWGRVFKEFPWWKRGGMQAYPVTHIAKQFGLEAFDFVKIDIEGAEGQVFAPNADVSWVPHAKVISLEVHDYFAGYFGLEDVSSRIAAVMKHHPFTVLSDNEHVLYLSREVAESLPSR